MRTLTGILSLAVTTAVVATAGVSPAVSSASAGGGAHATSAAASRVVAKAPARRLRRVSCTLRLQQRIRIANRTTYRLTGTVSPPRNGARVRIQLRTAKAWRTVTTVVLRRQSATRSQFRVTLRNPSPGIYRAQLVGTPKYYAATSVLVPLGVSPSAVAPSITAALVQEHVAEATYANVIARLGKIQPFTNVIASEQQHIATLEQLARTYAISLPTGPFTGEAAPPTRPEACRVGVTVEQNMIGLYDRLLPTVSAYPNVTRVFDNLRTAERDSHLPAFQRCS